MRSFECGEFSGTPVAHTHVARAQSVIEPAHGSMLRVDPAGDLAMQAPLPEHFTVRIAPNSREGPRA
jgi:hypothetical protein